MNDPHFGGVINLVVAFNCNLRHNYCIEIENESVYDY